MAQVLKLKRTAVSGKIPTTSQLELGELAINTHDGRIFFEKDNGTPSVSEILIVNTTNPVTGSLTLNGNISATNITLSGDLVVQGTTTTIDSTTLNIGDNIIELNYGGSQTTGGILVKDATGDSTISGSLLWDSTNLNIGDNIIELNYGGSSTSGGIYVKDATGASTTSGSLLWDSTNDYWKLGKLGSESQVVTLSNLVSNLPNGIVSSSSQLDGTTLTNMTVSGSFSGSFQGDGSNLTGLTVDQVSTVTDTFTNVTSKTITHNFGTKNVIVTIYDENDSYFIPSSIVTTNDNQVTVGFSGVESGRVVVAKGGHVVQGVASDANLLDGQDGTYYLDYTKFTNVPNGLVSGSSQITDLTTHKENVSGDSSYVVTHNLNESYPIVQAWNTSTSQQEVPSSITTNSANQVTVVFSTTFAGVIIVKK